MIMALEKEMNRKEMVERSARKTSEVFKPAECEKDLQAELPVLQQSRTEESPLTCTTPGESSNLVHMLPLQQKTGKGEEELREELICTICGMCFTGLSDFSEHEQIHTSHKPMKSVESKSVPIERTVTQMSNPTVQKWIVTRRKTYNCIVCGDTFRGLSHLLLHQKVHKGHKLFNPRECRKVLPQQSVLAYSEQHHIHDDLFTCTECGLSFNYQSSLTRHYRIHAREKGLESADSEKNRTNHQRRQSGEAGFICTTCGKSLASRASYTSHKRLHIRNRFFKCPDCGKHFTTRSTVKRHQRIHTGERPYLCTQCGKRFNQTSSLKTHEKLHTQKSSRLCII